MIVAIGHDHAGFGLREAVSAAVEAAGGVPLFVSDASTQPTDYPDVAAAVADALARGQAQRGILVCSSGAGVTVAANGHAVVRAALANEEYTARQMVEHDDVNVLTLGARVIGPELAAGVVRSFLRATFTGEDRHARRLGKVLDQRRSLHTNALGELRDAGQSIWLDSISRQLVEEGTISRYIAELSVTGVTSNPSILQQAIGTGSDYTADAYLDAMERRLETGSLPWVPSVASVFVSRWDVAADPLMPSGERGRLGLALMQEIYAIYRDVLDGPRFGRLAQEGARPQRVLWASTGTKNPALPDTFYLGRLAAPGKVDTVPEKTLLAYADHGVTCDLLTPDHDEARRCIQTVREAGVDIETLASSLREDGVTAFGRSWSELLATIAHKLETKESTWKSE